MKIGCCVALHTQHIRKSGADPSIEFKSNTRGLHLNILEEIEDLAIRVAEVSFRVEKERNTDIVKKRFSLKGETFYTLEEIGDYYDISRERVRQIEEKAVINLRKALAGGLIKGEVTASDALILEHESLKQELYDQDYILVEQDVIRSIQEKYAIKEKSAALNVVPLILKIFGYFKLPNKISGYPGDILSCWCLSESFDRKSIENVFKALKAYRPKANKVKIFDLVVKAKRDQGERIGKELLHVILKACPDFQMVDEDTIEVRFSCLPSLAEKAYRVLDRNKEAKHFNDILREVNFQLSGAGSDKMANSRALTNQMASDKRFVAVGKSGFWVLAAGNSTSTKPITELMELYFHQQNKPQSINDIYDYVSSKRPGVTRKSIVTYLYGKPQFIRTGDGEYSLSSWGGESASRARVDTEAVSSNIKNAIEEVFLVNETIKRSDLIKEVKNNTGISEATIRKAIKICREIEAVDRSGRSVLLKCTDIRLTSLSTKKPRELLREKVQQEVVSVMSLRQGKRIQKIKLYEEVVRKVDCIRPTFYAYLSEMTDIKQYHEHGKYYCEMDLEASASSAIPYLDLSPLENCSDPETVTNVIKATDKLNDKDVDVGLFELGRIFENTIKRYLELSKEQAKFTVTKKDMERLASMISCIDRNKDVIPIKFKPYHLTLLREDRNLRAHGRMPSESERAIILMKSPFIVEMYIDYIIKFSVQIADS